MKNLFIKSLLTYSMLISGFTQISAAPLNITVTASRSEKVADGLPNSIVVITQQDIEKSNATNIADILRGQGLLQVNDLYGDGSRADISMRGFGESSGSNTLIIVDGRRLNNADIQAPELSSVSLNNIERIEIIQGSAGVLYGDQAVGGVINIVTKQTEDFSAKVKLGTGSYRANLLDFAISDTISNGLFYRVASQTKNSDNYRDHNELNYQNHFGRIGYKRSASEVYFEYQYTDEELETPGALLANEVAVDRRQSIADFADDFSNTQTDLYRLALKATFSDRWSYLAEVTSEDATSDFRLSFRGFSQPERTQIREQREFTPRLVGVIPTDTGELNILLGADLGEVDYDNGRGSVLDQRSESAYLQASMNFNSGLGITLGARSADVENTVDDGTITDFENDANSVEFGINYQANKYNRYFLRIDENYRFPKIDEFTFVETGRSGLETQQGQSVELGYDFTGDSWAINLLAYSLKLDDEIAFDPTVDGPFGAGTGANVNFDSTQRDGASISIQLKQPLGLIKVNYSYVDPKFESGVFANNTISGVSKETASISLTHPVNNRLSIYFETIYTGERFLSGDNSNTQDKTASYSVSNFALQHEYNRWRYNLRVNNLFDKEYIESANAFGALNPSPTRNLMATVGYNF